ESMVADAPGFGTIAPSPTTKSIFLVLVSLIIAARPFSPRPGDENARGRVFTWCAFFLLTSGLYFLTPDALEGGSLIADRFLLFSVLAGAFMALSTPAPARVTKVYSVIAALIIAAFCGEYTLVSRRLSPAVAELKAAVRTTPENARVLFLGYALTPTCEGWTLAARTRPVLHWGLSGAIARDVIVLNEYQPYTLEFPLRYRRPEFAELIYPVDLTSPERTQAWEQALRNPGNSVQYVISWGLPSVINTCPAPIAPPFADILETGYKRVFSNHGASRLDIWQRPQDQAQHSQNLRRAPAIAE
ncbi:MAG: hypothetical protein KGN84_15750, partial [Acidobacteriota bacterium]|nr:hypothetical protein [Acidobacteriota bacterium]